MDISVESDCFTVAVNGRSGSQAGLNGERQELNDMRKSRRIKERLRSKSQAQTSEC